MRHLFLIFIFASTNLFSQTFYKIEPNNDKKGKFKDFPCYIEIDTTQVKDPKTVKVKYNGETIEPNGNRFYLKTMPFVSKTDLDIQRTDQDNVSDYKQKVKDHFENNHNKDKGSFYEIRADRDSVYIGDDYKAVIEIDESKVKNLDNITVLFYTVPIERKGNKFFIQYKPFMEKENSYELTITNKESSESPLKIIKYVYGLRPLTTKQYDYVLIPDKRPIFNSKKFKSFDDYFISSARKQKIEIQGKLIFSYTVMTDGSTRFDGILRGNLTDDQKKAIENIITDLKGWTPGEDKGKIVNVQTSVVYDYK